MNKLNEARNKINTIDKEMAKLFEERMNASKMVAEYKAEYALPIFDNARELEVINKNSEYIVDPVVREYYVQFLKETMNISKSYQARLIKGLRVAYSGVEGAFAHIAASKMFPDAQYYSYRNFEEAYKSVENGNCDVCVLPLENSFAGEVGVVMDLLFSGSLFINQVIELEVVHHLLAKKGTTKEQIKKVISHPQAISQCSKFINENKYDVIEAENTAYAAKFVSTSDEKEIAAIASLETAKLYDLEVVETNINEKRNNTTRFGAFTRSLNEQKSTNSNSHNILVFTVKNEAGALAKTLNIIGSYGFNMRSLRSRPMKELLWNYYFYVELEGNIDSIEGKEMLKALHVFCDKLKIVGRYSI